MHNNYYFLRQLSSALETKLKDSVISECFCQSKDELIIRFEINSASLLIKASLLPSFSCLSFPENFQRARKNSVDLFPQIIGQSVLGIRQFHNERSFAIQLSNGMVLLFKMHGNRTNIVLLQEGRVNEPFRNDLTADLTLNPETLDREIDWSYGFFVKNGMNPKAIYITFGKIIWQYLDDQNFFLKSQIQQWGILQLLLTDLHAPTYYLTLIHGKPTLSLVKTGEVLRSWENPIQAANDFYYTFTHYFAFSKEKSSLLNLLKTKLDNGNSYYEKNLNRLKELQNGNHYKIWADLIMANLQNIKPRSEKIILENFYHDNRPEEIKLKKDLSPQKNAEIFYKKTKNQSIEIERIQEANRNKEKEIAIIKNLMGVVETAVDLKSLRSIKSEFKPDVENKKQTAPLPYHEFLFQGYSIWVGKNAQSNDILTLKYGYKEDLWLHAKDVAGSHVLIKHQAGKNFPKEVIQHAASLAAFNSKRKNESLCPVIVTPKKNVRKRKGDPAGAVIVDREEVIMVEPYRFIHH